MMKKLFTLLLLILSAKSVFGMGVCYYGPNAQQMVNNALATANANLTAIQAINKKLESFELKNGSEANALKKDLDETKNLLKEMQTQAQTQNAASLQHKSEVIDVVSNFTKQVQSLLAESSRQNLALQGKVDQLLVARKRIESMLALFEASKTTEWEIAFVETLKAELKDQAPQP